MSGPKDISVVLIGLSSYGTGYARLLIEQGPQHNARLAGIVDPYAENNKYWPEVKAQNIPRYDTLAEFTAKHRAGLAVIASPIHLHCPQTCAALRAGLRVLCEKPVSGTIQEVHKMIAERERAGKFVGIGYNPPYTDDIQAFKQDIMAGAFGRPVRLKSLGLWPRSLDYYGRNNWAGKLRSAGGDWILDSPVNNATAHYLHIMFYLLGAAVDQSAIPAEVTAEIYRANDIENYDTACLRARTAEGVEIFFVTSHAVDRKFPIMGEFNFENAKVEYNQESGIKAVFTDGRIKQYPPAPSEQSFNKLWQAVEASRSGGSLFCGLEAAMAQTVCINGAQESVPAIKAFPREMVKRRQINLDKNGDPAEYVVVNGLVETLTTCYTAWKLPSEIGAAWAQAGRCVDLRGYEWFPGGKKPQ